MDPRVVLGEAAVGGPAAMRLAAAVPGRAEPGSGEVLHQLDVAFGNAHRLIVIAAEVTVDSPDFGHLEPMVTAAQAELEHKKPSFMVTRGTSGV